MSFRNQLNGLKHLISAAVVMIAAATAFAVHSVAPSTLETPLVHWDEPGSAHYEGMNRVIAADGHIQSVSQLREGPFKGSPEQAAREFLFAHEDWIGLEPGEKNLRVARVAQTEAANYVTFERVIDGVVVYPGNLVVTLTRDNYVLFYFSSLYTFKDPVATATALTPDFVKRHAATYLNPTTKANYDGEPELVIWAGDNRDFAACYRYRVDYEQPRGDWELLVDANSGVIRRVKNRAVAVNGTGYIFDPDPITSSGMSFGSPGLVDNFDATSTQLNNERVNVTLPDIGHFYFFGDDYYYLTGPYCDIQDLETPNIAPVMQVNHNSFSYTRADEEFEMVLCYYHIDKSQRWIQTLGYPGIQNGPLQVDPHAENFDCNAHYHPSGNYLTFGDGPDDVDAGEDAEVVLHEYGHAINNAIVPGWSGGDEGRMGEGWGDYWAGSYGRSVNPSWQQNWIVSWALNMCFGGRSLQAGLHYPEDNSGVHYGGQIWSQALHQAEINMNSRTVMNRLGLEHQYSLGIGASMLDAAQAVVTADINMYGGSHLYAISDAFVPRGLLERPAHDACPGYTVSVTPYTHTSSTATADHDYDNCGNTSSPDVIYKIPTWLFDCNTSVTVSLCGSGYDTYLSVYTDGGCPGTTEVACDDDACDPGLQSTLTFTATANTEYYIRVSGFSTYAGSYTLNVTGVRFVLFPEANDECSGALPINSLPYTDSGTTCNAFNDYANCVGSASADVFYTLNLPTCQNVTASLCGSEYDTGLEVRTGGACPGSLPVACNDDFCGYQSQVMFTANANQSYTLIVHGYDEHQGSFTLNVTGDPYTEPNDVCAGIVTIGALPFTDSGSTSCANYEGWPHVGSYAPDVIYTYTPGTCQTLRASNCLGTNYDSRIDIRAGGACPGDIIVASNDDFCGLYSQVDWFAAAGVPYYIIQYGYGGNSGAFELQVTSLGAATAPNDVCASSKMVGALPYVDYGSTVCATNDDANCGGTSSNEVYYTFTMPSGLPCNFVTASLCGSDAGWDSRIRVATDGGCPGTTEIVCEDDGICGGSHGVHSSAVWTGVPGTTYYITVGGYSTHAGTYRLEVHASCDPDSVVANRAGNDIRLDWASVGSGSITYKVYRDTVFTVPTDAAHLIGTSTTPSYIDVGRALASSPQSFYVVTTESIQTLMAPRPEAGAIAAVDAPKSIPQAVLDEMARHHVVPYFDPANIQTPNPNKAPQIIAPPANQYWIGNPVPVPGEQQRKAQ